MDSDETLPLLPRSPTPASPSQQRDDLSGDRPGRYSPPRSSPPPPPPPSPPAVGVTKGRSTSPLAKNLTASDADKPSNGSGARGRASSPPFPTTSSPPAVGVTKGRSTSPLAKNLTASDADKTSNGSGTRGRALPHPSPTTSSPQQGHQPQPRTAPKVEEEAAVDPMSKNHQELQDKASAGEEKEKGAVASAALRGKEKAAGKKKAEIVDCPFPGASTSTSWAEGDCWKGRSASSGADRVHLVNIDGSSPAPGTGRDLAALIHRAEQLSYYSREHPTLSGPVVQLSVALHRFAAAPDATAARLGLEEAAAALDKVSSDPEVELLLASAAKLLALEAAAALTAGRRGQEPSVSVSAAPADSPAQVSGTCNELLWAAMAGSLGLLPYLHDLLPKDSHLVVAILFGAVFSAASIGAVMTVRDVYRDHACIVGAVCFSAFSVLVIAFVSFALAQGNVYLICACTFIVVVAHLVILWMSRK